MPTWREVRNFAWHRFTCLDGEKVETWLCCRVLTLSML